MAANDIIARLGGWVGYEVADGWEEQRGSDRWCVIRLRPVVGIERCCSGCGASCALIHDCEERRVRDLPIFEVAVELIVPRLRVVCVQCGAKLERLAWLEGYSRTTTRLAGSIARLCQVMSIRHVARFYRLAWTTVKRIDFRHLQQELGAVELSDVTVIGMDEFAIQKGHRYATVVVEPARKRVLWVAVAAGERTCGPSSMFWDRRAALSCRRS